MDTPSPPDGAVARAGQAIERIGSFLRRVGGAVTKLAVAALAGGAVLWWAVYQQSGRDEGRIAALIVVGALALAPPFMLGRFVVGLRAVVELPRRLRESPASVRASVEDLGRRARAVSEARPAGPLRTIAATFRLLRSAGSSREVLGAIVPGALLLSPAMLAWTALAAAAAVLEVVVGALALLWLVLR